MGRKAVARTLSDFSLLMTFAFTFLMCGGSKQFDPCKNVARRSDIPIRN